MVFSSLEPENINFYMVFYSLLPEIIHLFMVFYSLVPEIVFCRLVPESIHVYIVFYGMGGSERDHGHFSKCINLLSCVLQSSSSMADLAQGLTVSVSSFHQADSM